jgi:hypothetical protein
MKTFHATGDRCAVNIEALDLPCSYEIALAILSRLGFSVVDVSLSELAQRQIGASIYRLGAHPNMAPSIVDCSSFVRWLYAQKGIWLPRLSIQQREYGLPVPLTDIREGDLIFTTSRCGNFFLNDPKDAVGHVGMYTGSGVVHAASKSSGVIETSLANFVRNFRGVRRYVPRNARITTLRIPPKRFVETSDDLRWILLRHLSGPSS